MACRKYFIKQNFHMVHDMHTTGTMASAWNLENFRFWANCEKIAKNLHEFSKIYAACIVPAVRKSCTTCKLFFTAKSFSIKKLHFCIKNISLFVK